MTGDIVIGFAHILEILLNLVQLLCIASVIVSWVNAPSDNQIVYAIRSLTEPMYRPIRQLTSRFPGPLDWAPFLLILLVIFLQKALIVPLMRFGHSMQ